MGLGFRFYHYLRFGGRIFTFDILEFRKVWEPSVMASLSGLEGLGFRAITSGRDWRVLPQLGQGVFGISPGI